MPSPEHAALVELLRQNPQMVLDLLERRLDVAVPPHPHVTTCDAILDQLAPTEYRADIVFVLRDEPGGPARLVVIVEVQLGVDPEKPWKWPSYLTNARARERCDACVLVVTPSAAVAAWARRPIRLGPGNDGHRIHVLGPAEIPLVDDPELALRNPALSVLSLLARGPEFRVDVLMQTLDTIRQIDFHDHKVYLHLIFDAIGAPLRRALEAHMATLSERFPEIDYPSCIKAFIEIGTTRGKAEAVLAVLTVRGIALDDLQRDHITACRDPELLQAWLTRAVTATTAADLFD